MTRGSEKGEVNSKLKFFLFFFIQHPMQKAKMGVERRGDAEKSLIVLSSIPLLSLPLFATASLLFAV